MDAEKIVSAYLQGVPLATLAAQNGVHVYHIKKALCAERVPLRDRCEVARLRERNDVPLAPCVQKRIEGELLGDGSLKQHKFQSFFSFRTSNREYAEWLANIFGDNGMPSIGSGISTEQHIAFGTLCTAYQFRTISTIQLHALYQKWYSQGHKSVPNDLEITPLTVLHWWLGDGSVRHQCAGVLCTDAFAIEEQELLSNKFNNMGLKTKVVPWGNYHRIYIHSTSMLDFLAYIGPAPFPSLAYKWQVRAPKRVNPFR